MGSEWYQGVMPYGPAAEEPEYDDDPYESVEDVPSGWVEDWIDSHIDMVKRYFNDDIVDYANERSKDEEDY